MRRCLGVDSKKFSALKSFERLVVCSPASAFRRIQKNFRRRDLANVLSKPRSAIQSPLGSDITALLRSKTATHTDLKSNRHISVIDAA
jgi:hypothetical protein